MIKKQIYINESNLAKIIQSSGSHVINLKEESFEYSNGSFIARCTYDLDLVIQKLFKAGAIANYKNWTPARTFDFKDITECEEELEAIKTSYSKASGNLTCIIFKINDKYVGFDKRYLDIFKNVEYKAADNSSQIPNLRIYGNGELVGILMAVKQDTSLLSEIIGY
ncbi:hypothetical protein [Clostridium tagluense]|uniref:Uncharacterized protein n=1 Tax=Clostridium tagluense TaxID=360422 RepID=A0A401UUC2_9CLOT|nr:hypothetical protein [Clostridium tagluense]GCD13169.1 hypothetical protein Ctaglu_47920 [Clostridium tagluense]